jgi:hypothetical protein
LRILDHLNRLAPERLRLRAAGLRIGDEVDKMTERLDRLDAAREALAFRNQEGGPRRRENEAKPKQAEALDDKGTGETADFVPSTISEA